MHRERESFIIISPLTALLHVNVLLKNPYLQTGDPLNALVQLICMQQLMVLNFTYFSMASSEQLVWLLHSKFHFTTVLASYLLLGWLLLSQFCFPYCSIKCSNHWEMLFADLKLDSILDHQNSVTFNYWNCMHLDNRKTTVSYRSRFHIGMMQYNIMEDCDLINICVNKVMVFIHAFQFLDVNHTLPNAINAWNYTYHLKF